MKGIHSLLVLSGLTILLAGAALFVGPVSNPSWDIIQGIRFPRVVLAIIVGAGLAGAGAVLQGVLRNPLADPFILGTSSAAAAGVVLAAVLGFQHYSMLYFMSIGFALASIFLVFGIGSSDNTCGFISQRYAVFAVNR